jgi:integrase
MRGRPLAEAEYRAMLKACKDGAVRRFLELLWYSGMRLREAERFSWDSPPVMAQMDSKPYPTILFYSEGHKAGQDTVSPMTPELHQWLAKTPTGQRKGRVALLPVLANEASRWITAIGEACEIEVNDEGKFASAHDLRRAFGCRWAKVVRPLTLQRLMRHKDFTTTLKYYIGLDAEDAGSELWGVPNNVPKPHQKRRGAASTTPRKHG